MASMVFLVAGEAETALPTGGDFFWGEALQRWWSLMARRRQQGWKGSGSGGQCWSGGTIVTGRARDLG